MNFYDKEKWLIWGFAGIILMGLIAVFLFFIPGAPFYQEEAPKQYSYASWEMQYESIEEMAAESDLIVEGIVTSQRVNRIQSAVFTISTVEITETISGEVFETVEVSQTGGVDGDYIIYPIYGAPLMEIGDEYILYLTDPGEEGVRWIAAGNQGIGKIVRDGDEKTILPFGEEDGRKLLGVTPETERLS